MIIYIKSKEEIEGFKEAGKIAGTILNKLIEAVDVGVTTNDLDDLARQECSKNNVVPTFLNYRGFPGAICASTNNVLVHGIPNNDLLQKGDIISIDMGVTLDGFIGDTARTTVVAGQLDINDLCRNILDKSLEKARAGNKLSDISLETFENRGTFSVPYQYGGHGINRFQLHADPFVANIPDYEDDLDLRPGIIIAVEPMLIDGSATQLKTAENGWDVVAPGITAHYEHTILITEDDPCILTRGE